MNDTDQQPTNPTDDDDVQIVDLDHPGSPQHRWATRFIGLVRKSLATPWIRYSLSASLLLILLGTLFLQLLRPTPPPASSGPKTPPPLFLSATTIAGLIFIQSTDHTLTAFQSTTGHVRWHIRLPTVSAIRAGGQILYSFFRTTPDHTELEALAANTGKLLWHDARSAAIEILRKQLEVFQEEEYEFNAFLIGSLIKLEAKEAVPFIKRAFEAKAVDTSIVGDWDDVRETLGLLSPDELEQLEQRREVKKQQAEQAFAKLMQRTEAEQSLLPSMVTTPSAAYWRQTPRTPAAKKAKHKDKLGKQARKKNRKR